MNKKRFRFNIIDALILIFLIAAAALLCYIFVFSDDTEAPKDIHTVEYVLVAERINKSFYDNDPIQNGDAVYDGKKKNVIGYVSKEPETPNSFDIGFDPVEKREVYESRDDLIDVYITIRCSAEKTDWGYNSSEIYMPVGASTDLIIGNMSVSVSTIKMTVLD